MNSIKPGMAASELHGKRWREGLKKVPGLAPFWRFIRIICNHGYRSEWLLQREKPENLFQPVGLTKLDRFPEIFSFVRDHLSGIDSPRLMSFGCSTGEEVFTLRRYFPRAEITGIDVNRRSIEICRRKLEKVGETGIRFELAGTAGAEPECFYDAVFCLSVLRHGDLGVNRPASCSHLIRFDDFDKTVAGLCRTLKPGGILAILGSNFRFSDTQSAPGFDVLFNLEEKAPRRDTPLYGPDDRLLMNEFYNDVIFCKRTNL